MMHRTRGFNRYTFMGTLWSREIVREIGHILNLHQDWEVLVWKRVGRPRWVEISRANRRRDGSRSAYAWEVGGDYAANTVRRNRTMGKGVIKNHAPPKRRVELPAVDNRSSRSRPSALVVRSTTGSGFLRVLKSVRLEWARSISDGKNCSLFEHEQDAWTRPLEWAPAET